MDSQKNKENTGIIVVDMQGDFTRVKQGALAVEGSDEAYLEDVRRATEAFKKKGYPVFATRDFHPENHISFYTVHEGKSPLDMIDIDGRSQVLWPPHCVQGTENARILLEKDLFDAIVKKGMNPDFDSYSGFFDDGGAATGMDEILKSSGIKHLIIYGLALDYCVRFTALDAVKQGYTVTVISDLCRSVAQETSIEACEEMKAAGIEIAHQKG